MDSVTEQPYKIPYYAALIRLLHDRTLQDDTSGVSYGRQILEDYWKGFQTYLDKLEWRNTRLCVRMHPIKLLCELTPHRFTYSRILP